MVVENKLINHLVKASRRYPAVRSEERERFRWKFPSRYGGPAEQTDTFLPWAGDALQAPARYIW